MQERLRWETAGADWPNATHSRFVDAAGLRWHVQVCGDGPVLLLLHGTGASSHSWRDLIPILSRDFTVVAPDLPGHGFTDVPPPTGLSLPGMAGGTARLCGALGLNPVAGVGHSAGAAILARQCLDRTIPFQRLVSLNGALLPFPGVAGQVFGPLAKLMSLGAVVPRVFAWQIRSDPGLIRRMISSTGSRIDQRGIELYRRLAGNAVHVRSTLEMMANWDLQTLDRQLKDLHTPILLVTGGRDHAVPPVKARRAAAILPDARVVILEDYGHLAHEEAPEAVAGLIREELLARG